MTENNYTPELPDQNAAYPTAPAYPDAGAVMTPNPYVPQAYVQAPKQKNGTAVAGFVLSLICVLLAFSFVTVLFVFYEPEGRAFLATIFYAITTLFSLLSLILSLVGANKSKRRGSGLGLALTGTILSTATITLAPWFFPLFF